MFLKVNGESVDINDGVKVSDLLDMFEIHKAKVAVERNGVYAVIF
jgi:sulfur carrier protein ThiS